MSPHPNVSPRPIVQGALWSYSSFLFLVLERGRFPNTFRNAHFTSKPLGFSESRGEAEAAALIFGSLYFILIKYRLAVKLVMLELMCVCVRVCVCECVCV